MNRMTLLVDAQRIVDRAKSGGRPMTNAERADVRAKIDAARGIDTKTQTDDDAELKRRIGNAMRDAPAAGERGRFSAKAAASALADKMSGGGQKALAPSGAEVAPAGLSELPPLALTRPTRSLLAAIPAQVVDQPPTYAYMKQTTRTNNAAPVASGGTKPTSSYGLTRVEDRLRVIAHLSEPVDRFWLEDHDDLRVFVEEELAYGLDLAVEQQVLNGSGVGENNRGLLQTSGIFTQAWSVDGAQTLRKALTSLQIAGAEGAVAVLHPTDWEAVSLLRSSTNDFIASDGGVYVDGDRLSSPPYGAVPLLSWGVPVILTTAITAGVGMMFDPRAVVLYTDGQIRTEWSSAAGFATNELTARCEGRFGVAVTRPDRVVSIDLTA